MSQHERNEWAKELIHSNLEQNELYHHGILGMHWGVRRYQPYGIGYDAKRQGKFIGDKKTYNKLRDKRHEIDILDKAVLSANENVKRYSEKLEKMKANKKTAELIKKMDVKVEAAQATVKLFSRVKDQKVSELKLMSKDLGVDPSSVTPRSNRDEAIATGVFGVIGAGHGALLSLIPVTAGLAALPTLPVAIAGALGGLIGGLGFGVAAVSDKSQGREKQDAGQAVAESLINMGMPASEISKMPLTEFTKLYELEIERRVAEMNSW